MPKKNKNVKIEDFSFRAYAGKVAASGARTIGWCDFTFVLEDTEIGVRDLKLRVNAKGEHTLCAPSRRYKNADGEPRTRSAYKFDDGTYGILVDAIFQSDDVVAALKLEPEHKETISLNA